MLHNVSKGTVGTVVHFKKISHTCVCVCSVTQSCLTLCNPMDYSPPGSSVHGMFQARIPEWLAISHFRGIFSTQRLKP